MPQKLGTGPAKCETCGVQFTPHRGNIGRFCSHPCRAAGVTRPFVDRLFEKVSKSPCGCWLWTGTATKNGAGYGQILFCGRISQAHRASYMHFNGQIPGGLYVLHSCDVPRCVNPEHLFLGTQLDNIRDAAAKGRLAYQKKA